MLLTAEELIAKRQAIIASRQTKKEDNRTKDSIVLLTTLARAGQLVLPKKQDSIRSYALSKKVSYGF